MEMCIRPAFIVKHKTRGEDKNLLTEDRNQELIKLQARIAELEKELESKTITPEKQDKILQSLYEYNFMIDSLF